LVAIWVTISPFPAQPISGKSLSSTHFIRVECKSVSTGCTGVITPIAIGCRCSTGR